MCCCHKKLHTLLAKIHPCVLITCCIFTWFCHCFFSFSFFGTIFLMFLAFSMGLSSLRTLLLPLFPLKIKFGQQLTFLVYSMFFVGLGLLWPLWTKTTWTLATTIFLLALWTTFCNLNKVYSLRKSLLELIIPMWQSRLPFDP